MNEICLREWDHRHPELDPKLAGLELEGTAARGLARELSAARKLEVLELARGISIRTTSYVGRVRLGGLLVTVQPKITGMPLLTLLRYAYGLRNLDLFPSTGYDAASSPFQELLIHQLAAEVAELLSRGLHREYVRSSEAVINPRGRLDFQTYARQGGTARAALPCIHHPRLAAILVNQVLLAGLGLGVQLTDDLQLRTELRRQAQILALDVEPVPLDGATLARCHHALDRRTAAYRPAIALIEMLLYSTGLLLEGRKALLRVPGFLFDMNRFFQALIGRFLNEHLADYTVHEESRIKGMMAYVPGHPRGRRSPEPRPDFVIQQGPRTVGLLDAKYRDLWEDSLPPAMLYQLAVYALSQRAGSQAVILYPTLDTAAREARIVIRDPVDGDDRAYVVLRPVDLDRLSHLVGSPIDYRRRRACQAFARQLAFGEQ